MNIVMTPVQGPMMADYVDGVGCDKTLLGIIINISTFSLKIIVLICYDIQGINGHVGSILPDVFVTVGDCR